MGSDAGCRRTSRIERSCSAAFSSAISVNYNKTFYEDHLYIHIYSVMGQHDFLPFATVSDEATWQIT